MPTTRQGHMEDEMQDVGSEESRDSFADRATHGSFSAIQPTPRQLSSPSTTSSISGATLTPCHSSSTNCRTSILTEASKGSSTTLGKGAIIRSRAIGNNVHLVDVPLPWRPSYLRRRILAGFVAAFLAVLVIVEVLLAVSRNNGYLSASDQRFWYLWTWSPIAILAFIAGCWSRVEFQAMSVAPWARLSKGQATAEETLLLDYLSMTKLVAIVAAIRNGDLAVASTASISIILKALLVVSAALFVSTPIAVPNSPVPIILRATFVDNATRLDSVGSLPYYTMLGMQQNNLTFPEGVTARYAFTPFGSDMLPTERLKATVDAFSASIDCEPAVLHVNGSRNNGDETQEFNLTLTTGACDVTMSITSANFPSNSANKTAVFLRFGHGSCGGSTHPSDQRVTVIVASIGANASSVPDDLGIGSPVEGIVGDATPLLCKPKYTFSKIDVVMNGTSLLELSLAEDPQPTTLKNIAAWSIAKAHFDSYETVGENGAATEKMLSDGAHKLENVFADLPMNLALNFWMMENGPQLSLDELLNWKRLESIVRSYYQRYTALLVRNELMGHASNPATGATSATVEKLQIRETIAHILNILASVATILTVATMFFVPAKGLLPRSPYTIIDMATLVAHSRPLLQVLRGTGGADLATIRERLEGSEYQIGIEGYDRFGSGLGGYFKIFGGRQNVAQDATLTFVSQRDDWPCSKSLRLDARAIAFAILIALIVLLEITLRKSNANSGLGDVSNDSYVYLLWTSLPTLVFAIFALFFTSADFTTRALAPYAGLRDELSYRSTVSLDLLNKSTLLVLYESIVTRNLAVIGTTLAVVFATLATIVASSSFSVEIKPKWTSVDLRTRDVFAGSKVDDDYRNATLLSSLILDNDMSPPGFVNIDMAFPKVSLADGPTNLSSDSIVTATIPALRAKMSCTMFQAADLETKLNTTNEGRVNSLVITLKDGAAITLDFATRLGSGVTIDFNPFFGQAMSGRQGSDSGHGSDRLYVWGNLPNVHSRETHFAAVYALACNETAETVNANLTVVGPSLALDPRNPPVPLEFTAKPADVDFVDLDYNDMANISTPHLLDGFFSTLVAARHEVPIDYLSNTARVQDVADAIIHQHRLLRAQSINSLMRAPLDTRAEPILDPADPNQDTALLAQTTIPAKLTHGQQHRLRQDAPTTRLIQGLLAALLASSVLALVCSPRGNMLPRPPHSIASVAALLADGNVFGLLGRDAEWTAGAELERGFRDGLHVTMRFRMGWEAVRRRGDRGRGRGRGCDVAPSREGDGGGPHAVPMAFAVSAVRTGGWGGGENVGLGMQARVGLGHRGFVRDWGWKT